MKKLFRTLLTAIIAIGAVCACVFAAACAQQDSEVKSDYNFTVVYEDGKAVNGSTDGVNGEKVNIQMCLESCIEYTLNGGNTVDGNGQISFSQQQINEIFGSETDVTQFTFHIWNVKDCEGSYVIAVNGKGDYTLKLSDAFKE